MLTLLTFLAWPIVLALLLLKRRTEPTQTTHYFSKHMLDIAWPFALVVTVYQGLVLYAEQRAPDQATIAQLIAAEQHLVPLKQLAKALTVPAMFSVGILFALLVLQFHIAGMSHRRAVHEAIEEGVKKGRSIVDTYGKVIKPPTLLITFAACFTLFGTELGEPLERLELRIGKLREGHAAFQREARGQLETAALEEAFEQALDSMPDDYERVVVNATELRRATEQAAKSYRALRRNYGVELPELERLEQVEAARAKRVETVRETVEPAAPRRRTGPASHPPPDVATQHALQEARELLERKPARLSPFRPALRGYTSGITKKTLGMLLSPNNAPGLAALLETHPLLDPVVKALRSVAVDRASDVIDRRAHELVLASLESPEEAGRIREAAAELVGRVSEAQRAATATEIEAAAAEIERQWTELGSARDLHESALTRAQARAQAEAEELQRQLVRQWRRLVSANVKPSKLRLFGDNPELAKLIGSIDTTGPPKDVHLQAMRTLVSELEGREAWERLDGLRRARGIVDDASLTYTQRHTRLSQLAQERGATAAETAFAELKPRPILPEPVGGLGTLSGFGRLGGLGAAEPFPTPRPIPRPRYTPTPTPRPRFRIRR